MATLNPAADIDPEPGGLADDGTRPSGRAGDPVGFLADSTQSYSCSTRTMARRCHRIRQRHAGGLGGNVEVVVELDGPGRRRRCPARRLTR